MGTPTTSHTLVSLSGRDRPGITARVTEVLDLTGTQLLDLGQSVLHGHLLLSVLLGWRGAQASAQKKRALHVLRQIARELGLHFETRPLRPSKQARAIALPPARYAVTLISHRLSANALHEVTAALARHHINIDRIDKLSAQGFGCVELQTTATKRTDPAPLKRELHAIARSLKIDVALQGEGLFRRSKRLVVFDLDSTLIQNEVINELAREHGVFDDVSRVTELAMRGEIDFDEALRRRVGLLKGLPTASFDSIMSRIRLTPGAPELVKALKRLGYRSALISGGFTHFAESIRARLGIDRSYSNTLVIKSGRLTGEVEEPILNSHRKAAILEELARAEGIDLDQVIAIGDGANDIPMLEKAGLGIAFNAKPAVDERATSALHQRSLKSVFYLLGFSAREIQEVLK